MRVILLSVVAIVMATAPVLAQAVKIQPFSEWIDLIQPDLKSVPPAEESGGYFYQLIDRQENLLTQETFYHYAYKLLTTEGVQEMADVNTDFDPAYESLVFHYLVIHRDGKVINKLQARDLRTIQREQSMDRYLYDGSLSVVVNVQDVRVGDVLEYAFTRKGYNPVFNGHYSEQIYFDYGVPYNKLSRRIIFPASKKIFTKHYNGEIKPTIRQSGKQTEYVWTLQDLHPRRDDGHLPGWFDPDRSVALTDFESWSAVSQWATEHFNVSQAEQNQLKKQLDEQFKGVEQKEILLKATRFVQDEVRYLGFESGRNSHKPHAPLSVFEQRFGDCKDKSLLLCTILKQYGIQASPMLVNTSVGSHTSDQLPAANIFDHCVVQITEGAKTFYVDPTISNQGGTMDNYYFPNYGQGLIIHPSTNALAELPKPVKSLVEEEQSFDMETDDGPATLTIRTTYSGSEADGVRSNFAGSSLSATQKNYLSYYTNLYPDIEVADTLSVSDNRDENTIVVVEKYNIPTFWKASEKEAGKSCEFYQLPLESYFSVSKTANRKTPYALSYPFAYHHKIRAHIPSGVNMKDESKKITSAYYDYRYVLSYNETRKELLIETDYETLSDHVPAEDVATFVKDHGEMMKNIGYSLTDKPASSRASSPDGIGWIPVVASFVILIVSARYARKLYYHYDPAPEEWWNKHTGIPIGGWLILIGIGVGFQPLRIFVDLIQSTDAFKPDTYESYFNAGQHVVAYVNMLRLGFSMASLAFSVLVAILFYERRTSLPKIIIIYYFANLGITVLTSFTGIYYAADQGDTGHYYSDVFIALIVTAIWVPYFNTSRRVKETFVNRT